MAEDKDMLRANLAALGRIDPALADQLRQTEPANLDWETSRAAALCASQ